MPSVSFTLIDNIDTDQFIATAYNSIDGSIIATAIVTASGSLTVPLTEPVRLEIAPDIGKSWKPSLTVALDDRMFVQDYIFKCTQAGDTGLVEPIAGWRTVVGVTTDDDTAKWICIDNIENPIMKSPVVPI